MRKLKVYVAQFGFYDSVVAATSQTAALRAWGTHQNLFAEGVARVETNEAAIKAALAEPGTPLRRPIGTLDQFKIKSSELPNLRDSPARPLKKARPEAKPAKPPPDRRMLDAAEADLRKIEDERARSFADLDRRQTAIDAERAETQRSYVEAKKSAKAAIEAQRRAYVKAGGPRLGNQPAARRG